MAKQFVENYLGLYFTVAPDTPESESLSAERQGLAHDLLHKRFVKEAYARFSEPVPGEAECRIVPLELCACDWETESREGKLVYSVWFHSVRPFTVPLATELKQMAEQAYRQACGDDAKYVYAELNKRWEEKTTQPLFL